MLDRAAQFSPFDALEGYSDEIDETARTTDERIELSEMQMDELNERINRLSELCAEAAHGRLSGAEVVLPTATVTYFVPDKEANRHSQKSGGAYVSYTGQVWNVDQVMGKITFQGENSNRRKTIAIADIADIQGDFARF